MCLKDCKDFEKSDFANSCKKDGGFFKCCIRKPNFNNLYNNALDTRTVHKLFSLVHKIGNYCKCLTLSTKRVRPIHWKLSTPNITFKIVKMAMNSQGFKYFNSKL